MKINNILGKYRSLGINFFMVFIPFMLWSQTKIEGVVVDEQNQALEGASITISGIKKKKLIAYDISGEEGRFQLVFSTPSDYVILKIRMMGYGMISDTLRNASINKTYILKKEIFKLKEVFVKIPPVTQKGDTISYKVSAFASKNDRTIADILEKMPGIEISPGGQIFYQGKPINKYYINGLDLLEGKYNLANENLPYEAVNKVEIWENHQPVKILDSLVYSDKAALNIKLKKGTRLTGQVWAGTGFSPFLKEMNLTPMLFSKNKQALLSYQTNNTGKNLLRQLNDFGTEEKGHDINFGNQLNIISPDFPGFSKKRWLENNSHLVSVNYLQRLKNEKEIKLNISYFYDETKENARINTYYVTSSGEWIMQEKLFNRFYTNKFQSELILKKNTKDRYYNNVLKINTNWNNRQGDIQRETVNINQKISTNLFSISNYYESIFSIGKQLLNLKSYIYFMEKPEELQLYPGVFESLLNDGNPYNQTKQYLTSDRFFTDNFVEFTKAIGVFALSQKAGVKLERNLLKTSLSINNTPLSGDQFANHINSSKDDYYSNLYLRYQSHKLKFTVFGKLNFSRYNISNKLENKEQTKDDIFFNPGISITYILNPFIKSTTSILQNKQWDDFSPSSTGYILQNYRSLIKTSIPVAVYKTGSFSQELSYRNSLQALFLRISYVYNNLQKQWLYQVNILPDGAMELNSLAYEHQKKRHIWEGNGAKYFPDLKTALHFQTVFTSDSYPQLINNKIEKTNSKMAEYSIKINTDITSRFSFSGKSSLTNYSVKISGKEVPGILAQSHFLKLVYIPGNKQLLSIEGEYRSDRLNSESQTAFFTDFIYRFFIPKKKWDFELQWRNIFNRKIYNQLVINNFGYKETQINLRPSQILIKIRFSL